MYITSVQYDSLASSATPSPLTPLYPEAAWPLRRHKEEEEEEEEKWLINLI